MRPGGAPVSFPPATSCLGLFVVCALPLFAAGGCGSGNAYSPPTSEPHQAGNFVFVHRLPPLFSDEDPELNIDLPVINQTVSPVHFEKVTNSCTCSGASVGKALLQPGERTTLHVSANLRHRTGPQALLATLFEPSGRYWQYRIELTIYERAKFDAANFGLHLGNENPGTEVMREVTFLLYSPDEDSFPSAPRFMTDRADLEIIGPLDGATEKQPDGCYLRRQTIKLRHKVPTRPGNYNGMLLCQYSHKGQQRTAKLTLTGYVLSLYEIEPKYIVFGQTLPESPCKRVLIRRTDGKPIRVVDHYASIPAVRVSLENPPTNDKMILVLSFDPQAIKDHTWGEVTLKTDHELQPSLKVGAVP